MTTKLINSLIIAALLACASAFAEEHIVVSMVEGTQSASFSVGDASCVLVNDEIRCTPVAK